MIFIVFMHAVLKPPENRFVAKPMFIQISIMQREMRGIYKDRVWNMYLHQLKGILQLILFFSAELSLKYRQYD